MRESLTVWEGLGEDVCPGDAAEATDGEASSEVSPPARKYRTHTIVNNGCSPGRQATCLASCMTELQLVA